MSILFFHSQEKSSGEILGPESLAPTMRFARLSPDYIAQEVKVLDRVFAKVENMKWRI